MIASSKLRPNLSAADMTNVIPSSFPFTHAENQEPAHARSWAAPSFKGGAMSQDKGKTPEEIPLLQRVYDSPFLLLLAGIVVMFILYTGWGVLEILSMPDATLP